MRKLGKINLSEQSLVAVGFYEATIESVELKDWNDNDNVSFRIRIISSNDEVENPEVHKGESMFASFNLNDANGLKFFGWALNALGLPSVVEPIEDEGSILFAEVNEDDEFTGVVYSVVGNTVNIEVVHSESNDGRTFANFYFRENLDEPVATEYSLDDFEDDEAVV